VLNSDTIDGGGYALIFTAGGGRLGNQLINYANLLAFSLEHSEFDILNLAFSPYIAEYGNESLSHPSANSAILDRPWNILVEFAGRELPEFDFLPYSQFRWLRSEVLHRVAEYRSDAQSIIAGSTHTRFPLTGNRYKSFDMAALDGVKQLRSHPISLVAGWNVRAWPLVDKHSEKIRSLLQPGEEHQAVAGKFVDSLRDEFDILIGALIRQGDYRNWSDGRYFFESSEYRNKLLKFVDEFPNKNVGILIASDEPQSEETFADDRFVFTTGIAGGDGHYVESFTELSLCDVVVTPPSTFSVSAAFLGDIPVVPLYKDAESKEREWLRSPLVDSVDHPEMSSSVN
jgi:hypothetical protein